MIEGNNLKQYCMSALMHVGFSRPGMVVGACTVSFVTKSMEGGHTPRDESQLYICPSITWMGSVSLHGSLLVRYGVHSRGGGSVPIIYILHGLAASSSDFPPTTTSERESPSNTLSSRLSLFPLAVSMASAH